MFNVGGPEVLIILVVALVVLGPAKLPEAARQVGRVFAEFRRMSTGFQSELRDAMKEPVDTSDSTRRPATSAAARVAPVDHDEAAA